MSWSASIPDVKAGSVEEDMTAGIMRFKEKAELRPEAEEQLALASKVAKEIVLSGVVGDTTRTFNVAMSGHANPGHAPAEGYGTDLVNVYVTQAPPQA